MLKKYIKLLLPPIIERLLRPKKKASTKETEYKIGEQKILLPPGHTLGKYQKMHKLFDRFLPVLAEFTDSNKTIVDIGANVGDTAMMMHQTSDAQILCVEPSDKFYPYLKKNVGSLDKGSRGQFILKKALVGSPDIKGSLEHYDGTAKFVESETISNSAKITLDEILDDIDVGLIKVDTDGYDFDVLNSGLAAIERSKPILFWENQMENEDQQKGYDKLYENLEELGYNQIFIFDNFGNLMLENANFSSLSNINEYINAMLHNKCTRTIYFTDVLACTALDKERVYKAIEKYKREWIKKEQ